MSEQLFDVVFFGILQAGKDREIVIQNMAKLFNTDASKLAPYFTGGRKVIKGEVNSETAEKYRAALENVGLVIKIEACENEASINKPAEPPTQQTPRPEQDTAHTGTDSITMAPPGVDVIENPVAVPAQNIADISGMSMAEAGADVIENPAEKPNQEIADISNITLAEPGSDVLEHPPEVIPQIIGDISGISIAETGTDIISSPATEEKTDIPDTSELTLDNEKHIP